MLTQGCDVVFHAAGGTGSGVIKACHEQKAWAIGVDSDQDGVIPGSVLTSMVKRCNVAGFNTIKDITEGKFISGIHNFGIKENGVDTTEFKYTKDKIPQEYLKRLEQIKQDIIDGKIVVTDYMAEQNKPKNK